MDAQYYRSLLGENLRLHRPELLAELRSDGSLESHIQEISEQALDQFNFLVDQLKKANPEPSDNHARMIWLSQIEQTADEIVRSNLIQLPDSDTEKAIRQGGYRD